MVTTEGGTAGRNDAARSFDRNAIAFYVSLVEFSERNRSMQRRRNERRSFKPIANMDVIGRHRPLGSGFYVLCQPDEAGAAKMNAWTVHIAVLSAPAAPPISGTASAYLFRKAWKFTSSEGHTGRRRS
ncbi:MULTISPECIES: hypothetical protein [Burkholderia]|uniref:hypothetical protein n=1 Tax=Burkholderia TaxID=32008 RepID=UPI001CF7E9B8|nr:MULTISPECIES: hypothetical protein [Burkholderia]